MGAVLIHHIEKGCEGEKRATEKKKQKTGSILMDDLTHDGHSF
jgi:hypothetical protein